MNFGVILWGSPLWMWILGALTSLCALVVIVVINREKINGKIIRIMHPELAIKVFLHNLGVNTFSTYWRIIPKESEFRIKNGIYRYNEKSIIMADAEQLVYQDNYKWKTVIDKFEYDVNLGKTIKERWDRWPQIHYFKGISEPINWAAYIKGEFQLSAEQIMEAINSDVVTKAFSMSRQDMLIMIGLVFAILSFLMSALSFAKLSGAIK